MLSRFFNVIQVIYLFAFVVMFALPDALYTQEKSPSYEFGFSSVVSGGDQAPFWVVSNRQGKYLPEKYASSMEFGIFAEPDTGKVFDYGYGLDFYGRVGGDNIDGMLGRAFGGNGTYWIHQAYAKLVFYDFIQLRGGMWEEIVGSVEPRLSSGSIIWSGNARPMPRIEIASPGYFDLPYTNGFVEMKGSLSHGWFEEGRYASDVWLHQKNLYARFGGDYPLNFYYGFNHYGQWGGSSPRQEDPYPSDFNAYLRMFFNIPGDEDCEQTPEGWALNKYGNSLGARNVGFDYNMNGFSVGIYQQDVFEDGSGLRRENFADGLWGAWIRFEEENKFLQAAVYEYLQTTYQSGRYHDLDGVTLGGNDNYFNHGHYRSGWTYHQYTIGTPLITSPLLNEPSTIRIMNNRVKAHHLGVEGFLTEKIQYRSLLTYSRNYGTYNHPLNEDGEPLNQFSFLLELTRPITVRGLEAGVTIAGDAGEMYGDNFGVFLLIRKTGVFYQ